MSKGIKRFLIVVAVLALAAVGSATWIESVGQKFFNNGKDIKEALLALSFKLRAKDLTAASSFYAADYQGNSLGLNVRKLSEDKDGVHRLLQSSDGSKADRTAALNEWRAYLDSFDSIESVALYVHRLDKWDSRDSLAARVRFEVIATPHGAKYAGIDRGYLNMTFRAGGEHGIEITSGSFIEGDRYIADTAQFKDVAAEAGVNFTNRYYPAFLEQKLRFAMIRYGPAGITAADYDNDGFYDLFIPDGVESKLFRNSKDGKFEDVTARAGLAGLDGVSVALFADYDNDGYKDLFVSRTFKPNQLFHNNHDGTFTDVTAKSGIGEDCCTTVASWADYDNDGYLDLYVGRYLDPRTDIPTTFYARNGLPNQLYHNNHDGTFTNVTVKAGVGEVGLCLGTVFGDYNDDGFPDIYVVNDFGRKTLYKNNGDGTFEDVTVHAGALAYGAGMSASFSDYDNDGKLDIYSTNIRSEEAWFAEWPTVMRYMANTYRQGVWITDMPLYMQILKQSGMAFVEVFQQMASGNTLLHNKGDGTFEDTTVKANANPPGWFWGASFEDFDNDGWKDIYAADGWVYNDKDTEIELQFLNNVVSEQKLYKTGIFFDPKHFGTTSWHGWEHNRYMRNRGDGTFEEIGRAAGNDLLLNSRGVAAADFWNRGAVDLAVSASTDKHALLRNDLVTGRHWLQIELVGVQSNRDAVGARVSIKVKGKPQMREVVLGDGYGSQNWLRQHFGLGADSVVDEITVKWPRSKTTQTFQNVQGDRIIQITEGDSNIVEKHYSAAPVKAAKK
ncbi:MAG TPA: CRTAC1 family protein [Bryobacteraceae bacterium]|nr:CRTAC1 family protein [Bryobacteraceae bacterium]